MAGIVNGLFAGRSGLNAYGSAMAVIGDNVANAGTIAYKKSRAEFEDIISGSQSSGRVVGSGSTISSVTSIAEQGTLEFTGRELDLAIDGDGYFVVEKNGIRTYTRAGNFKVNDEGFIVTQNGETVLGFPANGNGSLQNININTVSQSNIATSEISLSGNLDAGSDKLLAGGAGDIPPVTAPGFVPASTTTYSALNDAAEFSTVYNVTDSLGAPHTVTTYFFRTANDEYVARSYVNSDDVDSTTGLPRQINSMTMQFDSTGQPIGTNVASGINVAWENGSTAANLTLDFSEFTQYYTSSNIQSITDDGQGIGSVVSLSIDKSGSIFAVLDNGNNQTIGQVGLARFSNPEGLQRIGGNRMQETGDSGSPIIGKPDTGTFGGIESGNIELSTVDIAEEFTKMIVYQQAFSASSRIIRTISQLSSEIVQIV